jgi:hypothetical protein
MAAHHFGLLDDLTSRDIPEESLAVARQLPDDQLGDAQQEGMNVLEDRPRSLAELRGQVDREQAQATKTAAYWQQQHDITAGQLDQTPRWRQLLRWRATRTLRREHEQATAMLRDADQLLQDAVDRATALDARHRQIRQYERGHTDTLQQGAAAAQERLYVSFPRLREALPTQVGTRDAVRTHRVEQAANRAAADLYQTDAVAGTHQRDIGGRH